MHLPFLIVAFIAGALTFFAPCTLPLAPAFLGFICGAAAPQAERTELGKLRRSKIFINGVFFVLGFSVLFVVTGTAIAFLGTTALGAYRPVLFRAGGMVVFFFGLTMVSERWLTGRFARFSGNSVRSSFVRSLTPGKPLSALVLGGIFALGWTPCVGPVLGSILTLAATRASAVQGSILLASFSFGLAVPFVLLAAFFDSAARFTTRPAPFLRFIPLVAGVFLMALGILIATNNFGIWFALAQRLVGSSGETLFRAYL